MPNIHQDLSKKTPSDPREMLNRARRLWRVCLVLPFIYVGIAYLISRYFFPNYPNGLWPMQAQSYRIMLTIFAAAVVAIQATIILIRYNYRPLMEKARMTPLRVGELYLQRTLILAVLSDVSSALGLVAFLTNADWKALMIFCVLAYFLYIQAYPRGRFLGEKH